MQRLQKNSEAVGRLVAALAHGDVEPRVLPRRHLPVDVQTLLAVRKERRQKKPERKPDYRRVFRPHIHFFEEPDVPMVGPPHVSMGVTEVTQDERDRILLRIFRAQRDAQALEFMQAEIVKAEEELAVVKARRKFWQEQHR